jgi:serine/threonine protein phosphatase PrpC
MSAPTQTARVQIATFGKTDTGQRRQENQDAFLVADLSLADTERSIVMNHLTDGSDRCAHELGVGPKGSLVVVADGMGGAAAGAVASGLAITGIHHEMLVRCGREQHMSGERLAAYLREAVEAANAIIYQYALRDPSCRGMGTTATAAGILAGQVYLAQVGDSRAYLVRDGSARQLTRDQSVMQALVDAGMPESQAQTSADRNVILQALGATPEVRVVVTSHEMQKGDVVLLCSDGLFRVVDNHEIAHVLTQLRDPAAACEALIHMANTRGGPDNITVVIVRADL